RRLGGISEPYTKYDERMTDASRHSDTPRAEVELTALPLSRLLRRIVFEGLFGSLLLPLLFARTNTAAAQVPIYKHTNRESLIVIRPLFAEHFVHWRMTLFVLSQFLQVRLWIHPGATL